MDILTELQERNQALRAVGREKEVDTAAVVVSLGTGDPPVEKASYWSILIVITLLIIFKKNI